MAKLEISVSDAETGAPLFGVRVQVAGRVGYTDPDGKVWWVGVYPGGYTLIVYIMGWEGAEAPITVAEPTTEIPVPLTKMPEAGGWPWPLSQTYEWFQGLWTWVGEAAVNAVSIVQDWISGAIKPVLDWLAGVADAVWNALPQWMRDAITFLGDLAGKSWQILWDFVSDPVGSLASAFTWITEHIFDPLKNWFTDLWDTFYSLAKEGFDLTESILAHVGEPWKTIARFFLMPFALSYTFMKPMITWVWDQVKPLLGPVATWIEQAASWLTGKFIEFCQDPVGFISDGIGWVAGQVKTMFDGALGMIGDWVGGALAGVAEALGGALQGFLSFIADKLGWIVSSIMGAVNAVVDAVKGFIELLVRGWIGTLTKAFSPGSPEPELYGEMQTMIQTTYSRVEKEIKKMYESPPSPEGVLETAVSVAALLGTGIVGIKVLAASADAAHPTKDIGFKDIATTMIASTAASAAMAGIMRAPIDVGLMTPLLYAWNKTFTPNIPSYGDMIRIYVREGYLPEYQAEIPEGMIGNFALLGYNEYWTKSLWGAHWVLPSTGQVFEMLHRDIIDLDVMRSYLKTADILEVWRDRLIAISWNLPGRIDARWMAGWGLIDVDEYGALLVKGGLDPAWRDRVAEATVKQQMASEINKLRDNAKSDFIKGYISEAVLRADLTELGLNEDRVNYHVADAKADRDRNHKDALLGLYEDWYVKTPMTEEEVLPLVSEIIVDLDALTLWLERAYFNKYKKPRVVEAG